MISSRRLFLSIVIGFVVNAVIVMVLASRVDLSQSLNSSYVRYVRQGEHGCIDWYVERYQSFGGSLYASYMLYSDERFQTTSESPELEDYVPGWLLGIIELDETTLPASGILKKKIEAWGWPRRCAYYYQDYREDHEDDTIVDQTFGALTLPSSNPIFGEGRGLIPLRPLWSGLAINTAFFTSLAYGILLLLSMTRRLNRFNRGVCPTCAYEMKSDYSSGCPECGWNKGG